MNEVYLRLELNKILEGIAHYASFSLGKEAVLSAEPKFSRLKVERELARLSDAMTLVAEHGAMGFGGISDVSHPLQRAEKSAILGVEEIVQITRFMQGTKRLKAQFDAYPSYTYLDDLFASLVIDQRLLKELENSFSEQGFVLDRASSELKHVRDSIRRLEQSIDQESQNFLKKNADMLSENVVSLQEGRRTFLMKPSEKNKLAGTVYGTSASGQSVYFEPAFLARMQNELHGLRIREEEEITRICAEASTKIGANAEQMFANLETITLLDALFAKAMWGVKREAVVPTITKDHLYLEKSRHPLIPDEEVVPNTYRLLPPHHSILISGPNTGGKSVTLKTIGLSVLMTFCACPILADKAEIMLVDQVFVDIGDQQSIEKSLSSFSAHLQTIQYITAHATERSLILLDELGSQTDPLEGESMAMAILDYFRAKGAWVIATTHFSRLKQYGTQHEDILIASVEFDLNTLKPTYHYREGLLGDSNALAIASRLGLDKNILDQAFKYKQEGQYEEDHLLEILEAKIAEQDKLNASLAEKETAYHAEKARLEAEIAEVKKQLKDKEIELKQEYEQAFADLVKKAEKQLEVLNKTHRPDKRQEAVKNIAALQSPKPEVIDETITVGDRVQILNTQQNGVVEAIERKEAKVQVGAISMLVPLKKLRKLAPVKKNKKKVAHRISSRPKVALECNVIGKRVAEAIPIVEKYLDDCVVNGLGTARIVHGHGTGQLRNAVHQTLRRNKQVASFELASVSQGGAGATVVTFKE